MLTKKVKSNFAIQNFKQWIFCNSNVVLIEENFDDDAYQKALKHYKEQRSKAIDQVVDKMAEDVGYDVGRFAFLYNKVCYEVDFISFD